MNKLNYFDNESILSLEIPGQKMLYWVEDTLKNKSDCVLPPKISMKQEGHIFYNVMPCMIPSLNLAGVKVVNRYPQNVPSLNSQLILYDLENGRLKAVMDASAITTWRTAAVAVHSVLLFARKNFESIAFIGLGEVGMATLKLFLEIIDRSVTVRLYNYKNRAKEVIAKLPCKPDVQWEIYDDYEPMVRNCDVVVSAVTYAEHDFARESIYKKGCLLVPIHTLGFQECDLTFDKIFGDDRGHIESFKYYRQFKSFHEVSEVLNRTTLGRESDDERILAYNIGIAIHDIVFADKVFRMLVEH